MNADGELQRKLANALAEIELLKSENTRLGKLLEPQSAYPRLKLDSTIKTRPSIHAKSGTEEKIHLFRSLFHGREDVYALRWEGKNGKSGYSPACVRDSAYFHISKAEAKAQRQLLPLTDQVIHGHLSGKWTVGIYPLLQDERCWFLAADFDKAAWREDVAAYLKTCSQWAIPACLERSRSGQGAHVWIFFETPVAASIARKLGAAVLTHTMEHRHEVGLDSYDRFFPNQDTMPQGGFGNLIALPLQHIPRSVGHSVFLSEDFKPHPDQWVFLSSIQRMSVEYVGQIVQEAEKRGNIIGVRPSFCDGDEQEDPWLLPPSKKQKEKPISEPLPKKVHITLGNLVYIEKEGVPSSMLNRLMRLAAFQNPEFYRAQAMRLSTFDKPRVISCSEEFPRHLGLPRGCLREVVELLEAHKVEVELKDERFLGQPVDVSFHGSLRPEQQKAADALLVHDIGILSATTAFGKTVVAAWMIAARKTNTLILVHRRQLMDQWRERLSVFLDLPIKLIGQVGGGRRKANGNIDVAVIQSLNHKNVVNDMVANYGQVIVDECHHLSAFSFEQVLRQVKAKYVLGLTATPMRKDGHHPIIMMQCGPIRHRVDARIEAAARPFEHIVIPKLTYFRLPEAPGSKKAIHEIYAALVHDEARNRMILNDIRDALDRGRSPLLLTERTEHLKFLASRLETFTPNVIILQGGMGVKQRKAMMEKLNAIPQGEKRILMATGRYLGEGFDDARLDTLFLTMPISWKGTLQQYVGRLHRLHDEKKEVVVYDYVDGCVPMLASMFDKRVRGYESVGYKINQDCLL
ncbi:MAG: DEAD/DEAH box helicase family protein [Methylacidiphilales bacterium]|nr:DEAD/DEAH box helicase family protein [Candidatus Methylacidiphilales bacterium]